MNNINFKQRTDVKPPFDLDKQLNSYNILIQSLFFLIFLVIILLLFNPSGFNKAFGYEIFITGPILLILAFLIKELFLFKNTPYKSWLSSFSQSKETWFLPMFILVIIIIGLAGFFSMLAVAGVFESNPPENNTAMILNFVVIAFVLLAILSIYKNSKKNDDVILSTLPKSIQDIFALRTKYTLAFVLFCLVVTILYFVNPWGIMTNYGGPSVFFTLFIGIIFIIMITIYQYYIDNPSKQQSDTPTFMSFILKGIYILGSLGLSGVLIYSALKIMGVFDQDASTPESVGHIIFNLFLFFGMLVIVYKLAMSGGYLEKNPWYRLIINSIFYIPCLLVTLTYNIGEFIGIYKQRSPSSFSPPTPFETKMLFLSLLLISGYFIWGYLAKPYLTGKYLKQGGTQLVNQPIKTNKLTNVASYQTLNGEDKKAYKYAMSFWIYVDSFPPSTSNGYMKVVPLLSYGENPTIKYNSKENALYITVKQSTDDKETKETKEITDDKETNDDKEIKDLDFKPETINKWKNNKKSIEDVKSIPFDNELDADGHRIIYKQSDVLLQKWNHIVLNYNGGTLDVFYNGKLVKSAIEVVPYITYDMLTIGSENGIYGSISNLLYFKHPLDVLTIHTLYTSLKNTNPPSISENKNQLIPLSNDN
jgi:hypothetical protein